VRRGRVVTSAVLVAALTVVGAEHADAHDSLAPPGASHRWLPDEEWVSRHWVPFHERRLNRALGLRDRQLEAYLYNDHRVLAQLARRREISVEELTEYLVKPWQSRADPARLEILRERTVRVLTQGHLAQHIFFHIFHRVGLHSMARTLYGISPARFSRLRHEGHTPLEIARKSGLSSQRVRDRIERVVRAHRDEGVARQEAWPGEAQRIFKRQVRALHCWLRSPMPGADHGNPYGKATQQHGQHRRRWPSSRAQRKADQRRVERVRRSLTSSCWHRPPAFRARVTGARLTSAPTFCRVGGDGAERGRRDRLMH
jgi:hypothetical protein